jgi:hypothetical protein
VDVGIIMGVSGAAGGLITPGGLLQGVNVGYEQVFDLYDFEVASFTYGGGGAYVGAFTDYPLIFKKGWRCPLTLGGNGYIGVVTGWKNYPKPGIDNYAGPFRTYSGGATVPGVGPIPLILGGQAFGSLDQSIRSPDGKMVGGAVSVGSGNDRLPFGGSVMDNDYSQPFWRFDFHGTRGGKPLPPTQQETDQFVRMVQLALQGSSPTIAIAAEVVIRHNARRWRN